LANGIGSKALSNDLKLNNPLEVNNKFTWVEQDEYKSTVNDELATIRLLLCVGSKSSLLSSPTRNL